MQNWRTEEQLFQQVQIPSGSYFTLDFVQSSWIAVVASSLLQLRDRQIAQKMQKEPIIPHKKGF